MGHVPVLPAFCSAWRVLGSWDRTRQPSACRVCCCLPLTPLNHCVSPCSTHSATSHLPTRAQNVPHKIQHSEHTTCNHTTHRDQEWLASDTSDNNPYHAMSSTSNMGQELGKKLAYHACPGPQFCEIGGLLKAPVEPLRWSIMRIWLPANLIFVGMIVSSFFALKLIGVGACDAHIHTDTVYIHKYIY